jgi:hypothetical protein
MKRTEAREAIQAMKAMQAIAEKIAATTEAIRCRQGEPRPFFGKTADQRIP